MIKGLLSLGILFHLLAILVLPNPNSILSRELPVLVEYGNILTINTTWRFFSPNPLIRTIEYKTYNYKQGLNVPVEKEYLFPEPPEGFIESLLGREKYNRTLNYSMLISSRPEWAEAFLSKVLCEKHQEVDEIAVFQVHREFEPIEKARVMNSRYDSLVRVKKRRVADFTCIENSKETEASNEF